MADITKAIDMLLAIRADHDDREELEDAEAITEVLDVLRQPADSLVDAQVRRSE